MKKANAVWVGQLVLTVVAAIGATTLYSDSICHAQSELIAPKHNDFLIQQLFMPRIQAALEITDEQKAEIEELQDEWASQADQFYASLEGLSKSERQAKWKTRDQDTQIYLTTISQILLPRQYERFVQLNNQILILSKNRNRKSNELFLSNDILATTLELTDAQKKELARRADKWTEQINAVREQLAADLQELESDFFRDMLDELSVEQRQKYRELIGERFSFSENLIAPFKAIDEVKARSREIEKQLQQRHERIR